MAILWHEVKVLAEVGVLFLFLNYLATDKIFADREKVAVK